MEPRVLLVAAEWRLRAPLRAQLIDEGYDVMAVGTWDEAELLLLARAIAPRAVVIDLDGLDHPPATLATLARLVGPSRVLVLTSLAAAPLDEVRRLGFVSALARPFRVHDVVTALGRLLRHPSPAAP